MYNKIFVLIFILKFFNFQVHLSGNHITNFPLVFKDIKSLDVLDLSRNKITSIPDGVSNIYVIELILNQNQIASISDQVRGLNKL